MTVRVVLAVLLALALVAAAQPAIEHAQDTRDAAALDAAVDRTGDAISDLHRRSDPGPTFATAPRRTLDLDVPDGAELRIASAPPRLESQLGDGRTTHRSLPVRVVTCGDTSELSGEMTLVYVTTPAGPVVVATRGFIPWNGTTASHACAPSALRE